MISRPFLIGHIWLIAVVSLQSFSLGQDDNTEATKRILVKMVAERAKLVQFSCDVRVTSNTKERSLFLPDGHTEARYQVRRSAIDKYWVEILQFRQPSSMEPDGSIHGFWGSKTIFGTLKPQARPDIVLFESFAGKGEPNHELLVGALTDFRTIGLGLLKDQRKRIGLEDLEAKLLAQPSLRHIPRNDGVVRIKWDEKQILDIDTNKGFWPIYSKTVNLWDGGLVLEAEWRIQLANQNGYWVPKSAMLSYGDVTIAFEFSWKSVNEPILIGREGIEAIADEYQIPFIDRTK